MYTSLLALVGFSALSSTLAGPLRVARDSPDMHVYDGLKSNVLFMYQDRDCATLKSQGLPLSNTVAFSNNPLTIYHDNSKEQGIPISEGTWGEVKHNFFDMTSKENQKIWTLPAEQIVKTIVWTIDEDKYNFQAWRSQGSDEIWLVVSDRFSSKRFIRYTLTSLLGCPGSPRRRLGLHHDSPGRTGETLCL